MAAAIIIKAAVWVAREDAPIDILPVVVKAILVAHVETLSTIDADVFLVAGKIALAGVTHLEVAHDKVRNKPARPRLAKRSEDGGHAGVVGSNNR